MRPEKAPERKGPLPRKPQRGLADSELSQASRSVLALRMQVEDHLRKRKSKLPQIMKLSTCFTRPIENRKRRPFRKMVSSCF